MAKGIEYRNALPPGTRLHEFEFQGVLGSGGFGVTYRGFDHVLGKPVAIKEYLPSDLAVRANGNDVLPKSTTDLEDFDWGLERFLEEARALAQFDHPNIIRVHRFFEANNTGYIVMDYAEGETLGSLLKRERVLTPSRLGELLFPLLDGLEEMHRMSFLHRDIKPDNIIVLKKDGSPVIIDFGAARQAINAKSRSVTAIVTPGYAPIEQYSTRGTQGPATDIYSLAAVAYRAIVGERPDDSTNRLTDDQLEGWVHRVRGWDRAFLEVVDKGLAFNGTDRPQTVAEWRVMLQVGDSLAGPLAKSRGSTQRRLIGTGTTGVFRRLGVRWALPAGAACALAFSIFWLSAGDGFWAGDGDNPGSSPVEDPIDFDDLVREVRVALDAGQPDLADERLTELEQAYPDRPEQDSLRGRINALEREIEAREREERDIENLLEAGKERLASDQLTVPMDDNAVWYFYRVLESDPGNTEAQDGLAAVAERFGELIGSAIGEGNCGLAIQRLENLDKLNDTHPDILGLAENIAFLRAEINTCEEDSIDPPPPPRPDVNELCEYTLPNGQIVQSEFTRWWDEIERQRVCCMDQFGEISNKSGLLNISRDDRSAISVRSASCNGAIERREAGTDNSNFYLPPEAP